MTERLATAAARHPGLTIWTWIAAVVLSIVFVVSFLGDALSGEDEQLNNPESEQAYALIGERLPADPNFTTDVVLIRSDSVATDSPGFGVRSLPLRQALEETDGVVYVNPEPVARTERALVYELGLEDETAAENVQEVLEQHEDGNFDLFLTGEWSVERDFLTLSEEDLQKGELQFGLPVALIVLILVFGAVVAGLVPLALAIVAILTALGLVALIGTVFELSVFTINMLTGMGLALGIDYALIVVSRFREERSGGRDKLDAIAATGATASRAVLFSGCAFVIAMFGLLLIPNTIFRSLAAGAILVGITSVLAALTLLPAVLSLLGDRVNSLRIPLVGRGAERGTGAEGRFWGAIVGAVMRRPVVSLVLSVGALLALALPVLDFKTGEAGIRTMPDRFPSKQGFIALEQEFGVGTTDNVQVVVEGAVATSPTRAAIDRLAEDMREDRAFRQVETDVYPERRLALIEAILLNLLSVGAAYGALILVFQKGVGNELFGFQQVDFIEAWVPLFLFAVLFGLSMDYTVFLLSRIRERYLQTRDNDFAVAHGIGSTARLITGAALIIIAVFSGFALGDLVAFQQMGFGVAISLLIDATIIRSVILPATMKLLGEWNWYLPSWLRWLPDFHVEGSR